MNGVSFGIASFHCCFAYFVCWDVFEIARHLAAELGTNLAVLI
jgi:hypothetical protein